MSDINQRIESEQEVQNYIDKLQYALSRGAKIIFQIDRHVDQKRDGGIYTYGKRSSFSPKK